MKIINVSNKNPKLRNRALYRPFRPNRNVTAESCDDMIVFPCFQLRNRALYRPFRPNRNVTAES